MTLTFIFSRWLGEIIGVAFFLYVLSGVRLMLGYPGVDDSVWLAIFVQYLYLSLYTFLFWGLHFRAYNATEIDSYEEPTNSLICWVSCVLAVLVHALVILFWLDAVAPSDRYDHRRSLSWLEWLPTLLTLTPLAWRIITWFGQLAHYLDVIRKPKPARKVEAISKAEIQEFISAELKDLEERLTNTMDEISDATEERLIKISNRLIRLKKLFKERGSSPKSKKSNERKKHGQ